MSQELCFLTVAEASRLIKARKLSPVELTEAYLTRIETLEPQLNAFITVTGDLARTQAKAAERDIARRKYRGPMHGIPMALKDIFDTRGILTSGHSRVCIDRIPTADATVTRRLSARESSRTRSRSITSVPWPGPSRTARSCCKRSPATTPRTAAASR